jgi:hypothetical protein
VVHRVSKDLLVQLEDRKDLLVLKGQQDS